MTISQDVQGLEPGAIFRCFELDATHIGAGKLFFHGHAGVGRVRWQGVDYDYHPVAVAGIKVSSSSTARPTFSVADINGAITAICQVTDELLGARLVVRSTMVKYLDELGETPDPNQHFPDQLWFVERRADDDGDAIVFELASGMEFNGLQLPRRKIIASHCIWRYRDANCGYTGSPVADADGNPTDQMALDRCGKRLSDCKLRFGANGELRTSAFPAAGLVRM